MRKELSDFEREMNEEIESRISRLDQEAYDLGKPFNGWDWLFVGAACAVGLAMTLIGAAL